MKINFPNPSPEQLYGQRVRSGFLWFPKILIQRKPYVVDQLRWLCWATWREHFNTSPHNEGWQAYEWVDV